MSEDVKARHMIIYMIDDGLINVLLQLYLKEYSIRWMERVGIVMYLFFFFFFFFSKDDAISLCMQARTLPLSPLAKMR